MNLLIVFRAILNFSVSFNLFFLKTDNHDVVGLLIIEFSGYSLPEDYKKNSHDKV